MPLEEDAPAPVPVPAPDDDGVGPAGDSKATPANDKKRGSPGKSNTAGGSAKKGGRGRPSKTPKKEKVTR